jgi:Flp pilus assembly pilin Flp
MTTFLLRTLAARLVRDERGAVMSEYVVLLGAAGLVIAAAIAGLGPSLVASYDRARSILVSPMP